jgi:hypothetical protein
MRDSLEAPAIPTPPIGGCRVCLDRQPVVTALGFITRERRDAAASAPSGLAKQNTTKSRPSRRMEYVSGAADKVAGAPCTTSLFLRPRTFSAESTM